MLIRRRRRENPETKWGEGNRGSLISSWLLRAGVAVVLMMLVGLLAVLLWPERKEAPHQAPPNELQVGMNAAEAVARAFLAETDPVKCLQWVRNAEEVKARLTEYPEEARSEAGEIEKVLGHQTDGGRSVTGFVVAFSTGNLRLLEVVGTPDGPRVDLGCVCMPLHGKLGGFVVRQSGTCGGSRVLRAIDGATRTVRGSGKVDLLPDERVGAAACGARIRASRPCAGSHDEAGYPWHAEIPPAFHLGNRAPLGEKEPLFEINNCLAVGWVTGDQPVEDVWEKSHGE